MPYACVLFDLDHTLLDTDTSLVHAFSDAMAAAGAAVDGHYATFNEINQALWRKVEAQEISPNEVHVTRFEQLSERLDLGADAQAMADAFAHGMGAHGELYAGARELLEATARVAVLGMVTNGLGSIQRARIDRLGLGPYFSAITISGEIGTAKPDPAIFDHTFAQLGEPDRSQAIMVGDSLASDIAGGTNAGLATCWYNPHQASIPTAPVPTHVIDHLDQLLGLVDG